METDFVMYDLLLLQRLPTIRCLIILFGCGHVHSDERQLEDIMIDVGVEDHGQNFGLLVMETWDFKMKKAKIGISI